MIFDLHNDLPTAAPPRDRKRLLAEYAADGLTKAVFAIWTTRLPAGYSLRDYIVQNAPFGAFPAIEDLGRADLGEAFAIRPVYASLTWNGENSLAGGCGSETPLKAEGRAARSEMAGRGFALGVSHLSGSSMTEALDRAGECGCRVLASHTASRALCFHPRNLTDEIAGRIAAAGGIVGIAAVPDFLREGSRRGGKCGIRDHAAHILHMCEAAGTKHVAVGTDFFGTAVCPDGLSRYADFARLADILAKEGLSAAETEDIFYYNAERFFGARETI